MKTIKEKPKGAKLKKGRRKSAKRSMPAISAKQSAKLMKDKYVQQLDQRQSEDNTESQIAEQVEGAGTWAVDEVIFHESPRLPRQQGKKIKERPQPVPENTEQPESAFPTARPLEQSAPKEAAPKMDHSLPSLEHTPLSRQVPTSEPSQFITPSYRDKRTIPRSSQLSQSIPLTQSDTTDSTATILPKQSVPIKERSAPTIKVKIGQASVPSTRDYSAFLSESIVSIESIQLPEGQSAPTKMHPDIYSTTPNQKVKEHRDQRIARRAKAPPQCTPTTNQPTAQTPRSTTSVGHSAPVPQRIDPPKSNKPLPGRKPFGQKKINSQQTIRSQYAIRNPAVRNSNVEGKLSKLPTSAKGTTPKTGGAFYQKGLLLPKSSQRETTSIIPKASRTFQQTAHRRMTQRAIQQAKDTIRAPAAVLKKSVTVVTKVAATLTNTVATLVGAGSLFLAMVAVIIVAAVANSPFGLFFAQEPNAPGTVSVAQAVSSVNMAYNNRLELLQAGNYDDIIVQGQGPDWAEVLAVFAVKTAGADVDGLDVATLDTDRVDKLTAVFWDMTTITITETTIDHPASGSTEGWAETILNLTIIPKTADDMRITYAFSAYQNSALDELLSDRPALSSLAGSLTITSTDIRDVLAALPADLEQARQDTVQTALQLVGKVNYFWGGKSHVIGWDSRWGQLKKVTAAGNSTSGTYRPFGLDCSGFVDWTFNNSLGYIIGHGGGVRSQHTYCTNISQSEAQPGDLAFYPDDSHVGIVVGRNATGKLLVCHCSSGSNNVVVTEFSASGFTTVGRPDIFGP